MNWLEFLKIVLAIGTVFISIWYTIRHFKAVRTISYIERFNTPSMIETRAMIDRWSQLDDDEKLKQLDDDKDLFYRINLVYNLITEIGISYRYGIINKKLTCELFDPLIPLWSEKIQPYVYLRRSRGERFGYHLDIINNVISAYIKKNPKKYGPIKLKSTASNEPKQSSASSS